jgi:hypothetical protein
MRYVEENDYYRGLHHALLCHVKWDVKTQQHTLGQSNVHLDGYQAPLHERLKNLSQIVKIGLLAFSFQDYIIYFLINFMKILW